MRFSVSHVKTPEVLVIKKGFGTYFRVNSEAADFTASALRQRQLLLALQHLQEAGQMLDVAE